MVWDNIAKTEIVEEKDLFPVPFSGMLPNPELFAIFVGGNVVKGRIPVIEVEEVKKWIMEQKRVFVWYHTIRLYGFNLEPERHMHRGYSGSLTRSIALSQGM